jgi:hypothetical protein
MTYMPEDAGAIPIAFVVDALGGSQLVRQAIASGDLDAYRARREWWTSRDALRAFAHRVGGPAAVAALDEQLLEHATRAGTGLLAAPFHP